jgi:hypothetical protein
MAGWTKRDRFSSCADAEPGATFTSARIPMTGSLQLPSAALLVTALLFAACGGGAADRGTPGSDPQAQAPADSSAGSSEASDPASLPVTVADIDRWKKGMEAELAVVRESGEKLKSAKSGEDTLSALMGVQEMATIPAGARAAGIDEERYKAVRSNLSAAVAYLTPHLGGIDTTLLSAEQRDEMRRMNAAQLEQLKGAVPGEVVEALKPNAEALRKQEIELSGARLKGAGI